MKKKYEDIEINDKYKDDFDKQKLNKYKENNSIKNEEEQNK